MRKRYIILGAVLAVMLLAVPAGAAVTDSSGNSYSTYNQIYASSLSSQEKLALVQEMSGWTDELAAYVEWKNNGGDTTTTSKGTGSTLTTGLTTGTTATSTYTEEEQAAYEEQLAAYEANFAANYAATAAYTGSGSGTESDPYIITNPAELQAINDDLSAYYQLGNDIDLSSISSFTPIGFSSYSSTIYFTGTLDGNGYTISNLKITTSSTSAYYYGLFSGINGATVKNICFDNCNIALTGTASSVRIYFGLIAGIMDGESEISGIYFKNSNIIKNSGYYAGGLVGRAPDGNINNCILENIVLKIPNENGGLISGPIESSVSISNILIYESTATTRGNTAFITNHIFNDSTQILIDSSVILGSSVSAGNRIFVSSYTSSGNNYALNTVKVGSNTISSTNAKSANGADITATQATSQSFYQNTVGWDFNNIWYWDATAEWQDATGTTYTGLPKLQVFRDSVPPTISAVTATPATGGQTTEYTLSVSATTEGAGGIASYQWYFSTDAGSSWDAISGATAATYTFTPGTQFVGDVLFKAVVTGADGGVVDSYDAGYTAVKITVVMAPQISGEAASPTEGPLTQTVTLSASVSSTVTATYQWQELIGSTWTDISGATAASSTIQVADAAATLHRYRLAATSLGGTTYSGEVTYQSINPPTFSAVSADPMQGPFSQTVTLQATVSGADSYQWQEYAAGSWNDISGATAASSTIQVADAAATLHRYRLAATGLGGTAYSGEVTYQSVAPPVFSSFEVSPLSGGIPLTITFSAAASDTSGYRWEYSTDGTIWVQMASGASGSYTFTNEGVYYVRATATGTGGKTISSAATVTASDLLPEFTSVGVSPEYGVAPFTVTLTASATNDATFVWQMQSGSSWVQIGSGSPLTYTIPSGTSAGMVYFRAVATNQYGSTTSQTLAVEVGAAPAAEIASPAPGAVFGSNRLISFAAADAGAGVTYSWNFGDGQTGSGRTVTHSYSEIGFFMVTLTTSSQFGSSEDVVRIEIVEASGDIWLASTDVSSSGVTLQATIEVSPVSSGTLVWFELESMSGTVVYKSPQLTYSGPVSYTASGLPLMAGESYRAVAYSNYYGYSIPVLVTLVDAVQPPYEQLGNAWNDGLNREPFNVSALVAAGVGVYGGALGGGAVGAAVAFGVIVMFVLVGLWLRQQDIVIPLTLTLIAGWFVIGNLPGDWQPIAYTLMVVCVVAIFFYLFRKRIE